MGNRWLYRWRAPAPGPFSRLADGVAGRRAGADDRVVHALGAAVDGDRTRRHVDDHRRHGEGRHPARSLIVEGEDVALDDLDAADTGGDEDADVLGDRPDVEARVLDGLAGGEEGELRAPAGGPRPPLSPHRR